MISTPGLFPLDCLYLRPRVTTTPSRNSQTLARPSVVFSTAAFWPPPSSFPFSPVCSTTSSRGLTTKVSLAVLRPLPSSNSLAAAACLLFSSERLVKIYLGHLARLSEDTGDLRGLAGILVALTINCRRLNNSLEQGMAKILRWTLRGGRTTSNKQLIMAFMAELNRRMELQEVSPDTVCEMGVFITTEFIKKKGWDQSISTEISS